MPKYMFDVTYFDQKEHYGGSGEASNMDRAVLDFVSRVNPDKLSMFITVREILGNSDACVYRVIASYLYKCLKSGSPIECI